MRLTDRRTLRGIAVLLGLWAVSVASLDAQAQQGTIAGAVTDQTGGAPLPGVRISILNTNRSTVTNQEGRYTLAGVPAGTHQVQASLIGYGAATNTVGVTAGALVSLDFGLKAVAVSLDALVVTATGEQRGREVANVVSTIKASDVVPLSSVTNFGDLLSGRTANVQVLASAGTVGAGTRVRIRGLNSVSLSNEPIYYVDGVRMESGSSSLSVGTGGQSFSRINDINPEEIESVEIVKGPSAATLYGTQAANGVIRITTKRGLAGRTTWNVYSEAGVMNDNNQYPTNYFSWGRAPVTNTVLQCPITTAAVGGCTIDSLTSYNVLMDPATTINGTGYRGQVGLQVSGGSQQVQYFVAGEYDDELGHIRLPDAEYRRITTERVVSELPYEHYRPNEVKKASMRSNLQAQLLSNLDVALKAGLVISNGRLPQNDNNVTGMLPSGLFGKGYSGTRAFGSDWGFFRPGEVFSIHTQQDITRFTGSLNANWRPTSHLSARATVGLDHTNRTDLQFQALEEGPLFLNFRRGRKTDNRFSINQWTVDVNGSGTYTLSPVLSSKTTVGVQFLKDFVFSVAANGQEFPPGGQTVGAGAIRNAGEATAETVTLGAYIEQVIGYKDRLFFTGALRTDDNSAFGKDFGAVYYPKAQASWVISDEPFFPRAVSDNLRLRLAYGASGQQPGTIDAAQFFDATTSTVSNVDTPALIVGSLGNPELKPERSTELELGFDAGFLDGAAHLEFTYYNKKTRDALILKPLALSLGGPANQFYNIGSVQNRGVEAVLNVNTNLGSSTGLDLTLSGSRNSNKLLALGQGVTRVVVGDQRHVPGYPLFGFWARPILGYRDLNRDGVLTASEVFVGDTAVFLGYSIPRTEFSTNLGVTLFHNRVRVSGQLDYRGDFKQFSLTEYFRCTSGAANNCQDLNDPRASLDGQARTVAGRTAALGATVAGFIEDADFLKLRELSLTYHAPEAVARAMRATRASFTLTGRNLATITGYSGIDPELNQLGQSDIVRDFLTQPPVTYWTFRVNLGF